MNSMYSYYFFLGILITYAIKLYLNNRQIQAIRNNSQIVPSRFTNTINLVDHQKAAKYNIAKLQAAQIDVTIDSLLIFIFTISGGLQFLDTSIIKLSSQIPFIYNNPIHLGILVILMFGFINFLVTLPLKMYNIFVIEQKYGFNNTSIKLFINDIIKSAILGMILLVPLLYLILYTMYNLSSWWLFAWFILVIFNLCIIAIYPVFIAPLFNKFKPLEDATLNNIITHLLEKCKFKANGIFVMDGSKRSSHGNAYFTGFGKTKRIVFFDTLIKQLSHNEILAVLAHELGHFKKKHIIQQILISLSLSLIMLYILSKLSTINIFYDALNVSNHSYYNAIILFNLLLGIFGFLFTPIASFLSRKNEFEADNFAAQYTNKEDLITGLVKMYRDNASTLTPDKVYALFYYSHPPISIRINNLENSRSSIAN